MWLISVISVQVNREPIHVPQVYGIMITVLIILFKIGSLDGIDGIVTVLALQKLVNTSPDDIVVVQAKGALWMLQKDNEEQQLSQQKRMTGCSKLFCIPSCDW